MEHGTTFFTARLADTGLTTLTDHIDLLRDAVRLTRKQHPFVIDAAVVLPSEIHMIWLLPASDAAQRWHMIKSTFARHLPAPAHVCTSPQRQADQGIWKRGVYAHKIRDEGDYAAHIYLIQNAPVAHGLVKPGANWPYASHHQAQRLATA